MTVEQRLVDVFEELDQFEPSPDLFARVSRSISEDIAHRRRMWLLALSIGLAIAVSVVFFITSVSGAGHSLNIAAWRINLYQMLVSATLVVVLAPNIRRFGRSFVADVFHLSPETGDRFLRVMDVAYYLLFTGLIFVNFDGLALVGAEPLAEALHDTAFSIAFLLLAMGLLHAVNIAVMPLLGLIFNSVTRRAIRAELGEDAPTESMIASRADSNAQAFTIVIVSLAFAFAVTVFAMAVIGGLSG